MQQNNSKRRLNHSRNTSRDGYELDFDFKIATTKANKNQNPRDQMMNLHQNRKASLNYFSDLPEKWKAVTISDTLKM